LGEGDGAGGGFGDGVGRGAGLRFFDAAARFVFDGADGRFALLIPAPVYWLLSQKIVASAVFVHGLERSCHTT